MVLHCICGFDIETNFRYSHNWLYMDFYMQRHLNTFLVANITQFLYLNTEHRASVLSNETSRKTTIQKMNHKIVVTLETVNGTETKYMQFNVSNVLTIHL